MWYPVFNVTNIVDSIAELTVSFRKAERFAAFRNQLVQNGIDPKKTLAKQSFSEISMSKGQNAEEVYFKLHKRQQKGE